MKKNKLFNSPLRYKAVRLPAFNLTPKILLLCLFVMWLVSQFLVLSSFSSLQQSLRGLSQFPFMLQKHADLIRLYVSSGELTEAQLEITLSRDLISQTEEVLGAATLDELETGLKLLPYEQNKLQAYWQKITQVYPDYADAWLQLAIISYNEGRFTEALSDLETYGNFHPAQRGEIPEVMQNLH